MPKKFLCSWPGCSRVSPPLEPAQLARRGGFYFCPKHAQFKLARSKTPDELKKIKQTKSEIAKRYFELHPEIRLKLSGDMKKYYELHPEMRKIRGDTLRKTRGSSKDISRRQKALWEIPEYRRKITEACKKRFEDPGIRESHSKLMVKCFEDRQWAGSVKYYDGPQYCSKYTAELRERVRAWFGYVCLECGVPQNGNKLSIHHVWYNKKLCCDASPRSLVPLCASCHSKTSNLRADKRKECSEHFQNIIDTYYGGRCWFTREEMAAFK
jgi:hypothetical protein